MIKLKVIFILIIASITICSCANNTNSNNITESKLPFKTYLKTRKLSVDIETPNEFETIQKGNLYSNHYFGVSTNLPDNWKLDRGNSIFTLIRAYDDQNSSSISLMAIPVEIADATKQDEYQKKYNESPLKTMNEASNGDFRKKMLDEISAKTNSKISNFKLNEKWVSTTHYLTYEYEFEEKFEEFSIPFKTAGYQVILWGINYTFSHICAPALHLEISLDLIPSGNLIFHISLFIYIFYQKSIFSLVPSLFKKTSKHH
jgi:hypothetical protein